MSSYSPSHTGNFTQAKMSPFKDGGARRDSKGAANLNDTFGNRSRHGSIHNSPSEVYKNVGAGTTGDSMSKHSMGSPTAQTKDGVLRQDTSTSDWKSKLSPRARGRIQVALPTDNTTDYMLADNVSNVPKANMPKGDLSIKKEFAKTGNFPPRMQSLGLRSGEDKKRTTVYNNKSGSREASVKSRGSPNNADDHYMITANKN